MSEAISPRSGGFRRRALEAQQLLVSQSSDEAKEAGAPYVPG